MILCRWIFTLFCIAPCLHAAGVRGAGEKASVVSTVPVGFVTMDIAPGTGTGKRLTLLAPPLLGVDASLPSLGNVVAISDHNSLEVNMLDGVLGEGAASKKEEPFALQITSGSAEGLMFLVSTSTPISIACPWGAGHGLAWAPPMPPMCPYCPTMGYSLAVSGLPL
jgi:hypothetical protein